MTRTDTFIFHHPPKSGGTSVRMSLAAVGIPRVFVPHSHHLQSPHQFIDENLSGDPVVFHSNHAFADYQPRSGEFYFTWLRDPVEMFYSAFYFYRYNQEPFPYFHPAKSVRFIDEYIRPSADIHEFVARVIDERPDSAYPRGAFDLPFERMAFVGDTGCMDWSIECLSAIIGRHLTAKHTNRHSPTGTRPRADEVADLFARETDIYHSEVTV